MDTTPMTPQPDPERPGPEPWTGYGEQPGHEPRPGADPQPPLFHIQPPDPATDGGGGEPPADGPTPSPLPPPTPRARPRARRAVAVLVAAAVGAGLVGGVAGGFIGAGLDDSSVTATVSASGAAPVQSVSDKALTGVSAVAAAVSPSVVEVTVETRQGTGTGSGVVLTSDGKILTNAHVVDNAANGTLTVTLSDGRTVDATVLGTDSASDLAVVQAKGVSGLKAATLGDSDTVAVGDQVVAIGSPEGLTGTVTSGIVSALNREVKVSDDTGSNYPFSPTRSSSDTTTYKAIQTDASINPGNSGGPLLDMSGRVIGLNSAIYSPTSGALGSDAGSVGLGFAIPVNQVKALISTLTNGAVTA
ncbi:trypsin-like peptidase domain-containing protein [Yinghuangia seranimata]|uniref:trypsin-like peptidase domain-containing protein n=1 Tax=Yinghuangia seranimata TaxID=408067 RepID=UPI00248C4E7C|nr:trypsin-like peptidase domain-containing protein [Yinghuangia seranimata]MDI2125228.1 trypsin-like peptidase domain-containing protein [Yinghuangia seranimata]